MSRNVKLIDQDIEFYQRQLHKAKVQQDAFRLYLGANAPSMDVEGIILIAASIEDSSAEIRRYTTRIVELEEEASNANNDADVIDAIPETFQPEVTL